MPRINIPGRGPPKEPVPVEEATSLSTVPSTTQFMSRRTAQI